MTRGKSGFNKGFGPKSLISAVMAGAALILTACGGGDDQLVPMATASAAPTSGTESAAPVFSNYSKAMQGWAASELSSKGAKFDEANFNTIIFNVAGASAEHIVLRANQALDAGKSVLLDSDGSSAQMEMIKDITLELGAGAIAAQGMWITRDADKVSMSTPLFSKARMKILSANSVSPNSSYESNTLDNVFVLGD